MLSANSEFAEFIKKFTPFLGDFGHMRNRRAAMRPRREHLEISPAALRNYLHSTVRAIACPALEAEPVRLVHSGAAKEHALHAARYEQVKACLVIGVIHGASVALINHDSPSSLSNSFS